MSPIELNHRNVMASLAGGLPDNRHHPLPDNGEPPRPPLRHAEPRQEVDCGFGALALLEAYAAERDEAIRPAS
jgi:hypothetical protein